VQTPLFESINYVADYESEWSSMETVHPLFCTYLCATLLFWMLIASNTTVSPVLLRAGKIGVGAYLHT